MRDICARLEFMSLASECERCLCRLEFMNGTFVFANIVIQHALHISYINCWQHYEHCLHNPTHQRIHFTIVRLSFAGSINTPRYQNHMILVANFQIRYCAPMPTLIFFHCLEFCEFFSSFLSYSYYFKVNAIYKRIHMIHVHCPCSMHYNNL